MSTKPKTEPTVEPVPVSFVLTRRSASGDTEQLCRPLPPQLVALAPGAAEHEQLARRFGGTRSRLVAIDAKIAEATRLDDEAARQAIAKGKPIPAATVPAIVAERDETIRELDAIVAVIPSSATALLREVAPHAAAEAERLVAEATEVENAAMDRISEARAMLDAADALRAASGWCSELAREHRVRPFTNRTSRSRSRALADEVQLAVADERQRRAEDLAQREHDAVAVNSVSLGPTGGFRELPPPPTHQQLVAGRERAQVEHDAA